MQNDVITGSISKSNIQNQCTWQLSVTDGITTKEIGYPLTVEFNIVRNTFASANTATFNIYNLAPSTRSNSLFFQDRFNTSANKFVTFKAGYNGNMIVCFKGRIQECYSRRQGVETITSMQCLDLGIPTDYVNVTYQAGTTKKEAHDNIIQNFTHLEKGYTGSLEGVYLTPVTLEGKPLDVLNEISEGCTFIDNNKINTMQPNECLDMGVPILNADTGLLNTPQRSGSEIIAEGIFNPNATVGQLIEVQSKTASEFCGTFQLTGLTHSGIISGAVAGKRTTKYNFLVGAMLPNGSYTTTGTTQKQPFSKVKIDKVTPVNEKIGNDVTSVYNYIRSHKGQPPNTKVGHTDFTWRQLLLPFGTGNTVAQIFAQVNPSILQNCKVIAEKLYDFMKANLPRSRAVITSNWRSKENNARLSNASKESLHLRGLAIDFVVTGMSTNSAWVIFNKAWSAFTYRFFPTKGGDCVIHVQATLGKGGAKRA